MGNYEEEVDANGNVRKLHYISTGNGLSAIYEHNGNTNTLYYTYCDYQGNLLVVTDEAFNVVERLAYDPWGARRNPDNWAQADTRTSHLFARGYTLHEHLDGFNLINMNGRVYDPQVARFVSPDPFVQAPGVWGNFYRFGYCLNNTLIYTDPSGEFFWAALPLMVKIGIGIGAGIGAYTGYKIGEANGASGLGMAGYVLGGAAIGGFSGYLGGTIAAGGGLMANTSAIMAGSYTNSFGMAMLSGGGMAPSISFGVASFNFGTGELGYIGKGGNSFMENLGYGLGAFSNLTDIWRAYYSVNIKDGVGLRTQDHSSLEYRNGDRLLSYGGVKENGEYMHEIEQTTKLAFKRFTGITDYYPNDAYPGEFLSNWKNRIVDIKGVNMGKLLTYKTSLEQGSNFYRFGSLISIKGLHCTLAASRALNHAGVFNIPFLRMPWLLDLQMRMRDYTFISYNLNQ